MAREMRRKVTELATFYSLEPDILDIYVEGESDARFLNWFLTAHGRQQRAMPIDTVEVPTKEVLEAGFEDGNRGRVLTLGLLLDRELTATGIRGHLLVADRDLDGFVADPPLVSKRCLFTDFTSIELYGYEIGAVEKLLTVFLRLKGVKAEDVIAAIEPALVEIFLARAALHLSGSGIGLIDPFTGHCDRDNETVQIKMDELLRNSLGQSGLKSRPKVEGIRATMDELREKLVDDCRLAIRGHDFIALLTWYLKPLISKEYRSVEIITSALMTAIDKCELAKYPLFVELLRHTETNRLR
jgi:hypothetical protein